MKCEGRFLERRRRKQSRHPWNNLRCYIDVTGLVSVMIALLAIYLNDAFISHHPHGAPVDMPKVDHPILMPAANREDALLVNVTRDNRIYFGGDRVRPSDLPARIREGVSRGAERKVYIRADARARYGAVREVLDGISAAGVQNVGFLVEERRVP